jgi:hypothetical protein
MTAISQISRLEQPPMQGLTAAVCAANVRSLHFFTDTLAVA